MGRPFGRSLPHGHGSLRPGFLTRTDDTYSVTATAAAAGSTSVILQITGADGTTHSAACTVTVKESKTILDLIPGMNG